MPPRAVLFDFDGVLADTTNVHIAAWQRTFRAMGWNESDETCARAAEVADRAFVRDVFARRKIEGGDVEGWTRRKQALTTQLLRDRPHLRPGVAEVVQGLKEAGLALAIVTTTGRGNVDAVLAGTGLLDAFDVVVTGDDIPDPESGPGRHHLAIEKLGIDPAEAVALEATAAGLAAATRAGLRVVALAGARSADHTTVPGLGDLTDPVATLGLLGL